MRQTCRHLLSVGFLCWLVWGSLFAAPQFPTLTGRVVDNAHLLNPESIQTLETKLAAYEQATSNQVVVVTLPSLNGYAIDDYGYQLGRHWQIGQKGKNNGVLLIVAPKERKVRIEVGYGLEPILTDAISSLIIQTVILPPFKTGHYQQGIIAGTQSILDVLGGGKVTPAKAAKSAGSNWLGWLFFLVILFFIIRHPWLAFLIFSGSGRRFGGGSGGGFSGGGGSFGGGGSSGSW